MAGPTIIDGLHKIGSIELIDGDIRNQCHLITRRRIKDRYVATTLAQANTAKCQSIG